MLRTRAPVVTTILCGLFALDLLVLQRHVFRILKLEVSARGLPGSPGSLLTVLRSSGRADLWAPIVLIGILGLALIVIQWRSRGLSDLLLRMTKSAGPAALGAAIMALVGARYYLDAGLPHQFDAKLHLMRVAEVSRQMATANWPDWSFNYYGGFPLLRFSGPLFYTLAGAAALVCGSVAAGIKLVLASAHVGGALGVFALARRLGGSPRAAFLAAVGVAISFQHTSSVVLAGREPVGLLYMFFPLLLLAGESLAGAFSWRSALGFGLAAGALVLSHPGLAPYGVLAGVLFTLVLATSRRGLRAVPSTVLSLVPSGLVTVLITLGLVLPALAERSRVHIARMYTTTGLAIDLTPDLGQMARIAKWNMLWTGTSIAYVGVSLILLFLVLLVRRSSFRAIRLPLAITAAGLLFLTGGGYLSSRAVHFLVPILALGAGLAVDVLPRRAFPALVLLVLLDLGPTTFQSPFRPDLDSDRAFVARAADAAEGHRVMRVSLRNERFAVSEWASVYDVEVAVPTGPFREAASADLYPWLLDLLRRAEADLNTSGGLSEATRWGLRALDVRLLVFEDGETPLIPPDADRGLRPRPDVPALEVPGASPVLGLLRASELETLLARPDRDWAEALAAAPAALRTPTVVVDDPHRESRSLGFGFRAPTDGFLVLSLARLPGLTVTVDGQYRPVRPGPYGLAAVEVSAGDHVLEAAFTPTSLLATTRAASLLSLVLFVILFTGLAVRRRQTV